MKLRYNKKILIMTVIFICFVVCLFSLIFYFNSTYVSFNMRADNYSSFYGSSSDYGSNQDNYLSFHNGDLYAKNYEKDRIYTFTPKSFNSLSVSDNACRSGDKLFYLKDRELFCEDIKSGEKISVDNNCGGFVFDNQTLVYTKDNYIYSKKINGLESQGVIKTENEIYYLQISNGSLYLTERIYEGDGTQDKVLSKGKQYLFSKYDINGLTHIKSRYENFTNPIEYITVCGDTFYFYYRDTEAIYNVSLDDETSLPPVRHANVLDIASNNKKVYFVSEKTESNIIRETVECETNGLWELDVKSGELKKE